MPRITIPIADEAWVRLKALAHAEGRAPRDEASMLLPVAIERRASELASFDGDEEKLTDELNAALPPDLRHMSHLTREPAATAGDAS
jgi:hypothetical protein